MEKMLSFFEKPVRIKLKGRMPTPPAFLFFVAQQAG
jgi:hypothetical protein